MQKRIYYIVLLLVFYKNIDAQTDTATIQVSLLEAIETGLKNRYDVQADKYNIAIADNNVNKTKKEWMPNVSGSGNVRYNPQIQSTFIPVSPIFPIPNPELVTLGAHAFSVFGLDLNQNIYKPGITTDIKIAKNNTELQQEKNREHQNSIREMIIEAYLNVLLRELQYNTTNNDEQRYKEYLGVAEGQYKLGSLIENDYLKAKLDYENAKIATQLAKQNYDLTLTNLKYQMNVDASKQLVLTDNLNSYNNFKLDAKGDASNRTEIKQLLIQQEGNNLNLNKTRQNVLPTVSFFANYSKQYTYTNFADYGNRGWWSPFNFVGLSMSVPISGYIKNINNTLEYQYKKQQLDLDLKQKTADINYEIEKTTTELSNATQNMTATKNNYDLSKSIYENQKKQYGLGSLSYNSLLDTEKSLSLAEQNYIKSVFDYLVAEINYQKAIGNY